MWLFWRAGKGRRRGGEVSPPRRRIRRRTKRYEFDEREGERASQVIKPRSTLSLDMSYLFWNPNQVRFLIQHRFLPSLWNSVAPKIILIPCPGYEWTRLRIVEMVGALFLGRETAVPRASFRWPYIRRKTSRVFRVELTTISDRRWRSISGAVRELAPEGSLFTIGTLDNGCLALLVKSEQEKNNVEHVVRQLGASNRRTLAVETQDEISTLSLSLAEFFDLVVLHAD